MHACLLTSSSPLRGGHNIEEINHIAWCGPSSEVVGRHEVEPGRRPEGSEHVKMLEPRLWNLQQRHQPVLRTLVGMLPIAERLTNCSWQILFDGSNQTTEHHYNHNQLHEQKVDQIDRAKIQQRIDHFEWLIPTTTTVYQLCHITRVQKHPDQDFMIDLLKMVISEMILPNAITHTKRNRVWWPISWGGDRKTSLTCVPLPVCEAGECCHMKIVQFTSKQLGNSFT